MLLLCNFILTVTLFMPCTLHMQYGTRVGRVYSCLYVIGTDIWLFKLHLNEVYHSITLLRAAVRAVTACSCARSPHAVAARSTVVRGV